MNKSVVTNLLASLLVVAGYIVIEKQQEWGIAWGEQLLMVGYFALSGGLTNWIAIHMLFEKVPGLYGSGVIPVHFEEFKNGIKELILNEFFNEENLHRFLEHKQENSGLTADAVKAKIDFDKIYLSIVEAIVESPMGGMLSMVGGPQALEPLKEPIKQKLSRVIDDILNDDAPHEGEAPSLMDDMVKKLQTEIAHIVDVRLEELTPQMVKQIVQDMIRKHLGWLVVWGGVFGGLIGGIVSVI